MSAEFVKKEAILFQRLKEALEKGKTLSRNCFS